MTLTATNDLIATPVRPVRRRRPGWGRSIAWAFMVLVILASLLPFYWVLRTALSSNNAIYAGSSSLLPVQFSWGGFQRVFGLQTGEAAIKAGGAGQPINFPRYLLNSVVVALLITAGQVFFSAMAAYAFSRLRWRHRDTVWKVHGPAQAILVGDALFALANEVLLEQGTADAGRATRRLTTATRCASWAALRLRVLTGVSTPSRMAVRTRSG